MPPNENANVRSGMRSAQWSGMPTTTQPVAITAAQLANMTMMAFFSQPEVKGADVSAVLEKLSAAFNVPWFTLQQATVEVHKRLGDRMKTP